MAVAGTVVKKRRHSYDGYEVEMTWTSDAAGAVSEGGSTGKGYLSANGYLVGMIPTATAGVSDDYDITLIDDEGFDALRSQGLNNQQAADESFNTKYRSNVLNVDGGYLFFINKRLCLTIANAGNVQTGTVTFQFSRTQP